MDKEEESGFWHRQQQHDGCRELEAKYNRLVSKLMILQGQSEQDEITDSQARSKFQGLQQAIQRWANKVRHDLLKNGQQDLVRRAVDGHGPAMRILMYLLSVNRDTAQTDPESPVFTQADMNWAQRLASHAAAIPVVLSLGVWSGLRSKILRRPFPIGIDQHSERMFRAVMKTMDKERARRWMSQTMTALAKTDMFEEDRAAQMESVSSALWSELRVWPLMHMADESAHRQNLKGLVECAANLHRDLRCSRDVFDFVNPSNLVRGMLPDDVSHWDLLNLTQWLPLSGREDSEGALLCLYPGLERLVADGNAAVNISKPIVLVYDIYDVASFPRPVPTQSWWRGDCIFTINYPLSRRRHSTWPGQESKPYDGPSSAPREERPLRRRRRAGSDPNSGSSALKGPDTAVDSLNMAQETKRSNKAGTGGKRSGRRDRKRSPDDPSRGSKQKQAAKREKRKDGSSKGKSTPDKARDADAVAKKSRSAKGSKTPSVGAEGPIDQKHPSARDPGQRLSIVVAVGDGNDEYEDEEDEEPQEVGGDSDSQSTRSDESRTLGSREGGYRCHDQLIHG